MDEFSKISSALGHRHTTPEHIEIAVLALQALPIFVRALSSLAANPLGATKNPPQRVMIRNLLRLSHRVWNDVDAWSCHLHLQHNLARHEIDQLSTSQFA